MPIDYALLTDLYEITMAQGYRDSGHENTEACFHMYFRDTPFIGGYAIACGMAQLCGHGGHLRPAFSGEDIDYLSKIPAPGGSAVRRRFSGMAARLQADEVDIDAVPRAGRVPERSPSCASKIDMQCQLLEAALLNCVNFQTLIATKAARVCLAAQDAPVAEFGLRRAQGAGGGLWASRASIVGGCASTSNVLAGKMFDLPVSGTHAHSWAMAFPSELEAFRAYAEAFPKNCTLLVDTYNVEQGIDNATKPSAARCASAARSSRASASIRETWHGSRRWRAASSMRPA